MIAILTDKPNVGREIARVVGAHKKENGYMTGGGYMVTWTFGNMLSLAMPKDSGKARVEWEDFPLVPPPYLTVKNMKTDTGWNPDINVSSRQQVIETDRNGKAWIIMGVMDILPDQTPIERIKRTVVNRKTGEMLPTCTVSPDKQLSNREKEILRLIRQGFLSKEIAYQLGVSIYTVNNHRKNILSKLNANNIMEAIHIVENLGIYL